jgi:integral membrane protein (TIGR01906 family)
LEKGGEMRFLRTAARLIFIIAMPVLFLSASIAWGFNSLWIYEYGFHKYNVSSTSGLSPQELRTVGQEMIDYFNSNEEYIHITLIRGSESFELFTPEEQVHFKDVKSLVRLDYSILLVAFVLVLIYILAYVFWQRGKYRKNLARSLIWGSGVSLVLILIIGIASFTSFDRLFLQFHYLVFSNSYWSAQGYMLVLFGDLWFDAVLIGAGFMIGLALIFSLPAIVYLKVNKTRKTED